MIPITERISNILPKLRPSERSVAELILHNPPKAAASTISELANAAFTSKTTVMRFAQRIGLSGYSQMRYLLALEAGKRSGHDWELTDKGADALSIDARQLAKLQLENIRDTFNMLDTKSLERAIKILAKAKRVQIYAPADSAVVGFFLSQVLSDAGVICVVYNDYESGLAAASSLMDSDVAIGMTGTDDVDNLVSSIRCAKNAGAKAIAFTTSYNSPLANVVDEVLVSAPASDADLFGGSAFLGQIALINCVRFGMNLLAASSQA